MPSLNPFLRVETIRRAARSLADAPLRTTLTVSGIAIGIAALFSLLSIAEGIRNRIVNEWLSSGLMTSLSVMPQGSPNPFRERRSGRRPRTAVQDKPGETRRALDDAAMAEIARIAGVRRVWPVISRPVMLTAVGTGDDRVAGARSESGDTREVADAAPGGSQTRAADDSARAAGKVRGADQARASGQVRGADRVLAHDKMPEVNPAGPMRSDAPRKADPGTGSAASSPSKSAVPADSPPAAPSSNTAAAEAKPQETDAEYATLRGFDTDFFWSEDYLHITAGVPLRNTAVREALLSDDHLKGLGFKDATSAVGGRVLVRWREPVPAGSEGAEPVPGLPFYVALRSVEYRVVGVFEKRGALSLRAAGIIVPTEQARKIATLDAERLRSLFEGGSTAAGYPALDVYLTPGADLEAVESRIKEMRFETLSGAEIVSRIRRSILILQAVLGGLGAIAIAVATLGIANTLLTAVYERMREIGVMKAVGARRRDIRRQFFSEAGLIGLSGGIAGLILGFGADHLLALVIGHIARRQGGDDPGAIAVHTPMIAGGCLAFAILLSLLAGTFPAARAARLDPVRMLRHE